MRKEWMGVMVGLGVAGVFSACTISPPEDPPSESTSIASTSGQTGAGGECEGSSVAVVVGVGVGGSTVGVGGGPSCESVPPPDGDLDQCGAVASATSGGGTYCDLMCDDQSANTYEVVCDSTTNTCACMYNSQIYCACLNTNLECGSHCCPAPWDEVGFDVTGAGGGGTTVTTTGVSAVTGTGVGGSGTTTVTTTGP